MNKIQNKREINRIKLNWKLIAFCSFVLYFGFQHLIYFTFLIIENLSLNARVCVSVLYVCVCLHDVYVQMLGVCVRVCVYLCGSGRKAYASNVLFNCFLSVFASLCFTFFSLLLSLIHNLVIFFLVIYNIKTK